MKLNLLYEWAVPSTVPPEYLSLARECNPDKLLRFGDDVHSFMYMDNYGLLVDSTPGRNHADWLKADPEMQRLYWKDDRTVYGRFGEFYNLPVISIWVFESGPGLNVHIINPCLRALLSHVPSSTIVCSDTEKDPFFLSDIFQRQVRPRRTWKYRQAVQTSESYAKRPFR